MTAQEMFEKLHYRLKKTENCLSYYDGFRYIIEFILDEERYKVFCLDEDCKAISFAIDTHEHQAITQQMIELGWINNNGSS